MTSGANQVNLILFETRFESEAFAGLEPARLFDKGVCFAMELTNNPLLDLVSEGPSTRVTTEDGKVTFSTPMAFQKKDGTFPQLSLSLHVGEVVLPIENHLEVLLASVPQYRQATRTLIGLFPDHVRQAFFAKPTIDCIRIVDPISKKTQIIGTNTPIIPLAAAASLDALRDDASIVQIEERYLLMTSHFKSEKESKLAVTLSLFTRAEHCSHDRTIQFLHLFSAAETLCGAEIAPLEVQQLNAQRCTNLRELVNNSPHKDLLELVNSLERKINHLPLSGRFEQYQKRWTSLQVSDDIKQRDAEVMSTMNLKRNGLLHRGEDTIQTPDVIALESLVSRYLRLELGLDLTGGWLRTVTEIRTIGLVDPIKSVNLWAQAFDEASNRNSHVLCGVLAKLLPELRFPDEFQRARALLIVGQWHVSNSADQTALTVLNMSLAACQAHLAKGNAGHGARILIAQCLWNQGLVLQRLSRLAEARETLTSSAIEFDSMFSEDQKLQKVYGDQSAICRLLLARVLERLGDFDGADIRLEEARKLALDFEKLRPETPKGRELVVDAITTRSWHQFRVGRLDAALKTCSEAIYELAQANESSWNEQILNQGLILFKQAGYLCELLGRYPDALEHFDKAERILDRAISLVTDRPAILNNGSSLKRHKAHVLGHIGLIEEAKNALEEAAGNYSRATALVKNSALIHFNGGQTYLAKARLLMDLNQISEAKAAIREAEKALKKATILTPDPDYFLQHGQALYEKSRIVNNPQPLIEATKSFSQAIAGYADRAEPLNLAEAYRFRFLATASKSPEESKRDAGEAIRLLLDLLEQHPDNLIARDDLAATCFQAGELNFTRGIDNARDQIKEAAFQLSQYLAVAPDSVPHLVRRAKTLALLAEGTSPDLCSTRTFINSAVVDIATACSLAPNNVQVQDLARRFNPEDPGKSGLTVPRGSGAKDG